jgi:hypothetical protein
MCCQESACGVGRQLRRRCVVVVWIVWVACCMCHHLVCWVWHSVFRMLYVYEDKIEDADAGAWLSSICTPGLTTGVLCAGKASDSCHGVGVRGVKLIREYCACLAPSLHVFHLLQAVLTPYATRGATQLSMHTTYAKCKPHAAYVCLPACR